MLLSPLIPQASHWASSLVSSSSSMDMFYGPKFLLRFQGLGFPFTKGIWALAPE